jgi:methionine synthase II (cobalamin-independent)
MKITGVGSLPHTDAFEAAAFVAATTDLAYLPQLPNRDPGEGMLRQWADGLCGVGAVDDGIGLRFGAPSQPRSEAFVGASMLLDVLAADQVKTQFTGPVTLFLAMLAAGCSSAGLWDGVIDGLADRVRKHVEMIRRARPNVEIALVMDEPALVMFAPGRPEGPVRIEPAFEAIARVLADAPVPVGIHVCGDTDWRSVAGLQPAWLSWDLAALGDGFLSSTDAIAESVSQGTGIMWGMVPTDPAPVDTDRIRSRYGTAVTRLVIDGAPVEALTAAALATPACGLAGLSVGGAEVVMDRLQQVVGVLDAER